MRSSRRPRFAGPRLNAGVGRHQAMIEVPSSAQNAAAFSPAVDDVFTRIASRYDFMCDVFSLYAHRIWKNHIADRIANCPGVLHLDVASGTGDIPFRVLMRSRGIPERRIIVSDLCPAMLGMAQAKLGAKNPLLEFRRLDAHDLSGVESGSVDIYSISFGMKILDRERVLSEAHRVLRPGGRFFCLEAARIPVAPIHSAYLTYMDWCLPTIARLATGGDASAYDYLLRGVHEFPDQAAFSLQIEQHGFLDVAHTNLTCGIVALHEGVRQ